MTTLENNLITDDRESIHKENDVNIAYEFVKLFQQLYDKKNCPVREDSRKNRHKNKPWISKGLHNACKKNNTLYRERVKHRSIMRKHKKQYYSILLHSSSQCCEMLRSLAWAIPTSGGE